VSETSETVQFWRATPADVRAAAAAADVAGRIVASNECWTSFVPLEDDEASQLASEAPGTALVWQYSTNYGLGLAFFHAGDLQGEAWFRWETLPGEPPHEASPAALLSFLAENRILDSVVELEQLAQEVRVEQRAPEEVRDRAAELLRLPAYKWLSPTWCRDTPIESARERYPQAEDVK
jgi:hypothetical protein